MFMNPKQFDKGVIDLDKVFAFVYEELNEFDGLKLNKVFVVKAISEQGISIQVTRTNSEDEAKNYIDRLCNSKLKTIFAK